MCFRTFRQRVRCSVAPPFVRQRFKWFIRHLIRRWGRTPVTISLTSGERFALREDPIADIVVEETFGRFYDLYFPNAAAIEPRDGLILDVGAHHGVYTVAILKQYPSARLIAIEPDPKALDHLYRNIKLNGLESRVEVVEGAISDRSSTGHLLQSEHGSWANMLVPQRNDPRTILVCTYTLADVLNGRDVAMVKTNCEGGEFALIPQLMDLGQRPRQIILFAHDEAGDSDSLVSLLTKNRYDCRHVHSSPGQPRFVCELR